MFVTYGKDVFYSMRLNTALDTIFNDFEKIASDDAYICIEQGRFWVDDGDIRYRNQLKLTFRKNFGTLSIKDNMKDREFDCYYLFHLSDNQINLVLKKIKEYMDKRWLKVFKEELNKGYKVNFYKYIY